MRLTGDKLAKTSFIHNKHLSQHKFSFWNNQMIMMSNFSEQFPIDLLLNFIKCMIEYYCFIIQDTSERFQYGANICNCSIRWNWKILWRKRNWNLWNLKFDWKLIENKTRLRGCSSSLSIGKIQFYFFIWKWVQSLSRNEKNYFNFFLDPSPLMKSYFQTNFDVDLSYLT